MTDAALNALDAVRNPQGATGDAWLFPDAKDPSAPCSRHRMHDWWEHVARRAKLPCCARLGFHALRRAFATALKHLPLEDPRYLGGWQDPHTIRMRYQQPDADTLRQVMEYVAPRAKPAAKSREQRG